MEPAVLGLALTLLIQISTTNFPWIIRQSAEVSNQMVSVERMLEYGSLDSEDYGCKESSKSDQQRVSNSLQSDGSISVSNLTVRYRSDLPPALSGISFNIEPGQKVGVYSLNTGCSKSVCLIP